MVYLLYIQIDLLVVSILVHCSGGSRPFLMGGLRGGRRAVGGPIVMSDGGGGGAIAMSDGGGGGGGGAIVIFVLLMPTPRSGGPQGGPDSELQGHWPPLVPP